MSYHFSQSPAVGASGAIFGLVSPFDIFFILCYIYAQVYVLLQLY